MYNTYGLITNLSSFIPNQTHLYCLASYSMSLVKSPHNPIQYESILFYAHEIS